MIVLSVDAANAVLPSEVSATSKKGFSEAFYYNVS